MDTFLSLFSAPAAPKPSTVSWTGYDFFKSAISYINQDKIPDALCHAIEAESKGIENAVVRVGLVCRRENICAGLDYFKLAVEKFGTGKNAHPGATLELLKILFEPGFYFDTTDARALHRSILDSCPLGEKIDDIRWQLGEFYLEHSAKTDGNYINSAKDVLFKVQLEQVPDNYVKLKQLAQTLEENKQKANRAGRELSIQ